MILYIKHMVCDRCIMAVRDQLENAGLGPVSVRLGEAEFERELSDDEVNNAKSVLEPLGFGFIDDRKKLLAEQIKQAIIRLVHQEKPIFQHRKKVRSCIFLIKIILPFLLSPHCRVYIARRLRKQALKSQYKKTRPR